MPLEALGRDLGHLSRNSHLFRQGESFVTVDTRTGKTRPMDPPRFCSWVESVAWPYRPRSEGAAFSRMTKETSGLILASDSFRDQVRELRGVSQVRLPVWRGSGGARTVELLPPGFDEASGMLCLDTVPFDEARDVLKARAWFLETYGEFPWADERSRACFAVAMLAHFIRLLLPVGEKMLHAIFLANQAGSGKSLLAQAALSPCYGEAAPQPLDGSPEELRKTLDSIAMERAPYLWLDDMGNLRNRALNSFMSSGRHKCRVLGSSRTEETRLDCQVIITGNGLDVGPEIARRCLIVDLFCAEEAAGRTFKRTISPPWLAAPENRAEALAFLWAMVRNWKERGEPVDKEATRPGFEAFAGLAGAIVRAALLGHAFAPRSALLGGDEESTAIKALLRLAAEKVWPDGGEYRSDDLLTLAEENGLAETICPWAKNTRQSLGHKLKLWRGREMKDGKGRRFEFGRRSGHGGAIYPIRYLEE
jgi:hypothetical protein